ncbi:MAG TPA: response regulator [Geobacteraceae bacterium]|nr:response regulator [Geobacteraceae bacterium]
MAEEKPLILVVDDDPFVAEMLEILLEEEGYAVTSAENGREGLAAFLGNPGTALVLSDMNMPGMNGLELIREIRKVNGAVPFLLLTARDDESCARQARECGVQRCLVKDENLMDEIGGIVGQVLHGAT